MNIWILQTGEPLHIDNDEHRPMRAINLTNSFLEKGNNVTIWSSTFYHQKKKHRFNKNKFIKINRNFSIYLLNSPGYKKNIGFGRLFDHFILSIKLLKELIVFEGNKPDFIFIGYPPIEVAFVMSLWAAQNKIPFFVDVKDQWPDYFCEVFPKKIRFLIKFIFLPYFLLSNFLFRKTVGFSSMSFSYLNWCLKKANRKQNEFDYLLPLTSPSKDFSENQILNAENWWKNNFLDVKENKYICFIGTISNGFDFYELSKAFKKIEKYYPDLIFVIAGNGVSFEEVRNHFKGLNNTIFTGWISSIYAETLLKNSIISIAPYKDLKNFKDNIPNKIIDSFRCSTPVLTSLSGETKSIIEKNNIGFFTKNNSEEWFQKISFIINNEKLIKKMSINAWQTYLKEYEYHKIYNNFVTFIEKNF